MSHWILLVAPLALASFVMLFAFVGCQLETGGLGGPEQYKDSVTNNTNLVGYWRLGEAVGATTAVDSKGGHNGTYVGGVTLGQPGFVVGDSDTAAQFDGSTGHVTVPHSDALNPAKFTVEAIADVAGGEGHRAVASSRDISPDTQIFGYAIYVNNENKWEAWVGDGASGVGVAAGGPDATPGRHYLAMTYDGKTLKLYVDPAADAPATAEVVYQPNTARDFRIGAGGNESDTPQHLFNGVVDEVAVYNVDLDFATIQSHFELATNGPSSG
ncbi:MAG TPA: LamG domain-containing protein [Thermoleophilaceae bacterium]|jgi:hypothetical protein